MVSGTHPWSRPAPDARPPHPLNKPIHLIVANRGRLLTFIISGSAAQIPILAPVQRPPVLYREPHALPHCQLINDAKHASALVPFVLRTVHSGLTTSSATLST